MKFWYWAHWRRCPKFDRIYHNLAKRKIQRYEFLLSVEVPAQFQGLNELIGSDETSFIVFKLFVVTFEENEHLVVVSNRLFVGQFKKEAGAELKIEVPVHFGWGVFLAEYFLNPFDHVLDFLQTQTAVFIEIGQVEDN